MNCRLEHKLRAGSQLMATEPAKHSAMTPKKAGTGSDTLFKKIAEFQTSAAIIATPRIPMPGATQSGS